MLAVWKAYAKCTQFARGLAVSYFEAATCGCTVNTCCCDDLALERRLWLHHACVPGLSLLACGRSETTESGVTHSPRARSDLRGVTEQQRHKEVQPKILAQACCRLQLPMIACMTVSVVCDSSCSASLMSWCLAAYHNPTSCIATASSHSHCLCVCLEEHQNG